MTPNELFQEDDQDALRALVSETGLATIVCNGPEGPLAAHAPVVLKNDRLGFHLARGNALCERLSPNTPALVLVTGANAYISPDWYGSADQVPTWNYVSAELRGPVRRLDLAETTSLLDALAAQFEAEIAPKRPWTRAKMGDGRFEALLGAIIGFEMKVTNLRGVRKLSQNKPPAQRARVIKELASSPRAAALAIAALMRSLDEQD